MTKADLVSAMAKASGSSKVSAERALGAFFANVFDALKRGRRVTIGGFGTFMVSKRVARDGRNPRTGKVIRIPAARVPRFKPSRSLKSAVR
jgi:DNA-binding protein HU-beta